MDSDNDSKRTSSDWRSDLDTRALRWVGIIVALLWPLIALIADIVSDWTPGAWQVTIFVAGVLGLIGMAFGLKRPSKK